MNLLRNKFIFVFDEQYCLLVVDLNRTLSKHTDLDWSNCDYSLLNLNSM